MAKSDKYVVIAGVADVERPAFLQTGFLEKKSGQTQFEEGSTEGQVLNRRGDCGTPTGSENWGARVYKMGEIPETPIDVKDPRYRGLIEFLEWGNPKGMLINIRFLKGYNTLDKMYQDLVLNADENLSEDDANSADAYWVVLQTGKNEFSESKDPWKVLWLKNTAYNENSISKNPEHISFMFREENEEKIRESQTQAIDDKGEAIFIVKHASADNSYQRLRNLYHIVGVSLGGVTYGDELLHSILMTLADKEPSEFMGQYNDYKKRVSDIFTKAKSYGILDLTSDGKIVSGGNGQSKKEIIANIPGDLKGEKMIDWVYGNPLEPISYSCVFQLKQITDKLK